ncbi:MAG: hypothetical protein CL840_13135 [Crocinitomicaceae bacterium]|nr:hypothetical protein [Crocinitomicaceae bacterium]|tara:strand:- start:768 stop:1235 length:468 start_codon:yes stop_codon:yes gene_type:complete
MSFSLSADFKKQVYNTCCQVILDKKGVLEAEMKSALDSGNEASKSSVGDKHETGRAMAQLAQENLSKQIHQLNKLQQAIDSINPQLTSKQVELGCLVRTNSMLVFIGVSLGEIKVKGHSIFAISMASPLGQAMKGKNQGEHFLFNGQHVEILELR